MSDVCSINYFCATNHLKTQYFKHYFSIFYGLIQVSSCSCRQKETGLEQSKCSTRLNIKDGFLLTYLETQLTWPAQLWAGKFCLLVGLPDCLSVCLFLFPYTCPSHLGPCSLSTCLPYNMVITGLQNFLHVFWFHVEQIAQGENQGQN